MFRNFTYNHAAYFLCYYNRDQICVMRHPATEAKKSSSPGAS